MNDVRLQCLTVHSVHDTAGAISSRSRACSLPDCITTMRPETVLL